MASDKPRKAQLTVTKAECHVCKLVKDVHTIRNGFRTCQRCTAVAAKNAYDGLEHRPTISYVDKSLKELRDSVAREVGAIRLLMETVDQRLTLLESAVGATSHKRS